VRDRACDARPAQIYVLLKRSLNLRDPLRIRLYKRNQCELFVAIGLAVRITGVPLRYTLLSFLRVWIAHV
jgi:urease accessory protein UreF